MTTATMKATIQEWRNDRHSMTRLPAAFLRTYVPADVYLVASDENDAGQWTEVREVRIDDAVIAVITSDGERGNSVCEETEIRIERWTPETGWQLLPGWRQTIDGAWNEWREWTHTSGATFRTRYDS